MTLKMYVKEGIQRDQEMFFTLEDVEGLSLIHPMERMITDSTEKSFVYLIDGESQFNQIHFTQDTWSHLQKVLEIQQDPYIEMGTRTIQLRGFVEELLMLIENIEGNDNYGTQFVEAVENTFSHVLPIIE